MLLLLPCKRVLQHGTIATPVTRRYHNNDANGLPDVGEDWYDACANRTTTTGHTPSSFVCGFMLGVILGETQKWRLDEFTTQRHSHVLNGRTHHGYHGFDHWNDHPLVIRRFGTAPQHTLSSFSVRARFLRANQVHDEQCSH